MSIPTAAFILLLCILRSLTINIPHLDDNPASYDDSNEYELDYATGLIPLLTGKNYYEVTDTCKCGHTRQGRIVGGTEAEPGRWCWQVKLQTFNEPNQSGHSYCGGVVINDEYILTAAHCRHGRSGKIIAHLGAHKLFGDTNQISILAASVTIHPDYDPSKNNDDLAIVKLTKKIKFTDKICSVCLPEKMNNYTGKECIVTGWGRLKAGGPLPNELRQAEVTVVPDDECRKQYVNFNTRKICAAAPGKDACQGDSGGPMVYKTDQDIWELVGIISSGHGCANPSFAGVNVNVCKYLPWIYRQTYGSKYCKRVPNKKYLFPTLPNIATEESVTAK